VAQNTSPALAGIIRALREFTAAMISSVSIPIEVVPRLTWPPLHSSSHQPILLNVKAEPLTHMFDQPSTDNVARCPRELGSR
jgi:hypothetical protein